MHDVSRLRTFYMRLLPEMIAGADLHAASADILRDLDPTGDLERRVRAPLAEVAAGRKTVIGLLATSAAVEILSSLAVNRNGVAAALRRIGSGDAPSIASSVEGWGLAFDPEPCGPDAFDTRWSPPPSLLVAAPSVSEALADVRIRLEQVADGVPRRATARSGYWSRANFMRLAEWLTGPDPAIDRVIDELRLAQNAHRDVAGIIESLAAIRSR